MAAYKTFGDWRPIRNAIEAAYRDIGEEVPSSIPKRDWNLAGSAIAAYQKASMPKCMECKKELDWHSVIRCLDCKQPLCEQCAPRHFWPNGRPKPASKTHHEILGDQRIGVSIPIRTDGIG